MNEADERAEHRILAAGAEITNRNASRFRAKVELAASSSERVIVDLRGTQLDSWAFLMLVDLNHRLGPRIDFVAPSHLRKLFADMKPAVNMPLYSSPEEALSSHR